MFRVLQWYYVGMETVDFSNTPVISDIMSATGIVDGWIVICLFILVLALVFFFGWLSSALTSRKRGKELLSMRRELLGMQALNNLPPLHAGETSEAADSLVFATFEELKERQIENAREQREAYAAQHQENPTQEQRAVAQDSNNRVFVSARESQEQYACEPQLKEQQQSTEPNVTEQVHDAIFASVTGSWNMTQAKREEGKASRKKRVKGEPISAGDIPPIHVAKGAERKGKPKPSAPSDPNLSGRIPRM